MAYYPNNNIPQALLVKLIAIGVVVVVIITVSIAFIRPWYNVWSQEMEGKAEFAKAE